MLIEEYGDRSQIVGWKGKGEEDKNMFITNKKNGYFNYYILDKCLGRYILFIIQSRINIQNTIMFSYHIFKFPTVQSVSYST